VRTLAAIQGVAQIWSRHGVNKISGSSLVGQKSAGK